MPKNKEEDYLITLGTAIEISNQAIKEHLEFLLTDWKHNIKRFDFTAPDILNRMEINHGTIVKKIWRERIKTKRKSKMK